ncbi:MAG TPA: helix-turn-helix domain-containing protein [Candidatus Levybacteria bacterium]|nr:helix-turn-helix domain-containing protein [Candidatus Levybacteria bacterium]
MKQKPECGSVRTTLNVIGGKWKPLILWVLTDQTLRFNELHKSIEGVTQKMLTQQLRDLEYEGLIKRKVYPVVPPKVEYSLTEYGKSLQPILKVMAKWGKEHTASKSHDICLQNNGILRH